MKIATATDDGKTISRHFGRAAYYLVLTVENDRIVRHEKRDKPGHDEFSKREPGRRKASHGQGREARSHHAEMIAAIRDCQVVLSRGMGWGAYERLKAYDITPIITEIADIEGAVRAYLDGTIIDHRERLH
ncbi:MAG: NifB/NifX family molybdenum-iron cluster-binding protein [Anaerolineae bacterium]